jgi:CheY-like chemotaxis protein
MNTFLIIEDDPYVQRYLDRLFRLQHYSFEIVGSGEEGIARAKALNPVFIFLDIMMPRVDGLQVLTMLKSAPETEHIPVVILSNFGEDEIVRKAMNLGASEFIIKSNTPPEELVGIVDKYLGVETKTVANITEIL